MPNTVLVDNPAGVMDTAPTEATLTPNTVLDTRLLGVRIAPVESWVKPMPDCELSPAGVIDTEPTLRVETPITVDVASPAERMVAVAVVTDTPTPV